MPELLDLKIPHGMAGIREFDAKPLEQLLARQGRGGHLTGAGRLCVSPRHMGHRTGDWDMLASPDFDTMPLTDCKISKGTLSAP